jgi:hypothetical protein
MPPIHSKEKLEENKRYDITYLEYPLVRCYTYIYMDIGGLKL